MAVQILTRLNDNYDNSVSFVFPRINVEGIFRFYVLTPYQDLLGYKLDGLYFDLMIANNSLGIPSNLIETKRLVVGQNYLKAFSFYGFAKLEVQGATPSLANIDQTSRVFYG